MEINEIINPETEYANVQSGIHMYSKQNPSMHKIGLKTLNLARKREKLYKQEIIKPEGNAELHKSKLDQEFHKQQLKLQGHFSKIKANVLKKNPVAKMMKMKSPKPVNQIPAPSQPYRTKAPSIGSHNIEHPTPRPAIDHEHGVV